MSGKLQPSSQLRSADIYESISTARQGVLVWLFWPVHHALQYGGLKLILGLIIQLGSKLIGFVYECPTSRRSGRSGRSEGSRVQVWIRLHLLQMILLGGSGPAATLCLHMYSLCIQPGRWLQWRFSAVSKSKQLICLRMGDAARRLTAERYRGSSALWTHGLNKKIQCYFGLSLIVLRHKPLFRRAASFQKLCSFNTSADSVGNALESMARYIKGAASMVTFADIRSYSLGALNAS